MPQLNVRNVVSINQHEDELVNSQKSHFKQKITDSFETTSVLTMYTSILWFCCVLLFQDFSSISDCRSRIDYDFCLVIKFYLELAASISKDCYV